MNKNFYGFVRAELKSNRLVGLFDRAMKYYKPFRIIRRIFAAVSLAVTLLGTGVVLLVLTVLSLVVLPIAVLVCFGAVTASMLGVRKARRRLTDELGGRRVEVVFPSRERIRDGSELLCAWARSRANGDGALIVVSPYFVSPRGLFGRKAYLALRVDGERVYILRKFAYFRIRKDLFTRIAVQVVCYF